MDSVRSWLASIGAKGGRRSRRSLAPATARDMVKVREARRAYRHDHAQCFWSYRPDLVIRLADVPWVADSLHADRQTLEAAGYTVDIELSLPGFIRAIVRRGDTITRLDWAHDSTWRFLPLVQDPQGIWLLSPIDLAINKVLALAGRDEPRDFIDIMFVHRTVLPLAALTWAAVGKDPGLTPLSLLELLKRPGRTRPEEVERLHLNAPFDLVSAKSEWLDALGDTERFARERPADEAGWLYYARDDDSFVRPDPDRSLDEQGVVRHFGRPSGVLPRAQTTD